MLLEAEREQVLVVDERIVPVADLEHVIERAAGAGRGDDMVRLCAVEHGDVADLERRFSRVDQAVLYRVGKELPFPERHLAGKQMHELETRELRIIRFGSAALLHSRCPT
jgi:hypothetical protein